MIRFRIATLGTIDEVWKDHTVDVAKIATVERDRLSSALASISQQDEPKGACPGEGARSAGGMKITMGSHLTIQSPPSCPAIGVHLSGWRLAATVIQ